MNSDGLENSEHLDQYIFKESELRRFFLNLLVIFFIMSYYLFFSELYGSISTPFIKENTFNIKFEITLMLFVFLSVLAGGYRSFIAGFIGELLYQTIHYNKISIWWCLIIAILGLLTGLYKYKPLKYENIMNIYYTFISLIIAAFIISSLITIIQVYEKNLFLEEALLIFGIKFFLQSIVSYVFIVPIMVFIYDYTLAKKERHIYHILLTHHTIAESDHTFYLKFGNTYIYFCSRCSGMILGIIFSSFIFDLVFKIFSIEIYPLDAIIICIIAPIPGLIDWGTQKMLLRKSTTETRLITGFIIGIALNSIKYTDEYSIHLLIIIIIYFIVFGMLMFFGERKRMRVYYQKSDSN